MAKDLPSVEAISAKLQALLTRAREVKTVETIEPPLPVSDFVQDISRLGEGVFTAESNPHRFSVVELAARKLFYDTVNSTSIRDPQFVRIWDLLDLLLLCGERGQSEPILPFWLIEELLDTQTTDGCRVVFDYLESRRERLSQKDFQKTQLALLRSCNELLRRLSRAEDAVFCGRVFFFLFQTFPLGDKSSVNLRGEYHTENITTYETDTSVETTESKDKVTESEDIATQPERLGAEAASTKQKSSGKRRKDGKSTSVEKNQVLSSSETTEDTSKLYPIFWRLQHDFSEPTRLFKDENFDPFKEGLEQSLTKFKKTPVVVQTKNTGEPSRGVKRKHGEDSGDHYTNNYNPKYLTSRDLFELELSDLAFQRHVLLQSLIIIDFLVSLTERSKKKWADLEKVNPKSTNKTLIYSYTLSDEREKWASTMRSEIIDYLRKGPEGKFYCRMVDTVLARDKNWTQWKLESCPSIVKDPMTPEESSQAQAGAKQATANRRMKTRPMGTVDVSFLSEAGSAGGLERLKDPARFSAPSIEALVRGIENDDLDLDMAMTDEEKQSLEAAKSSKSWRAMRAASRSSLGLLDKIESTQTLQKVFVQEQAISQEPASVGDGTDIAALDGNEMITA